ncbi:magnesium transporter NIPA-domain-containing protein [Ochromonadaceae sp. CCMP2298]|nr:magnesium transporter NIPA-domain-containing protein [Ochromonadaceae sp. CCMP2298]
MVQAWVLGVVLGTTGSIGNNLGNNLVRLIGSPDTSSCEKECEAKPGLYSWCFIGRLTFVIGNLVSFASFAFGAQSLIASLDSVQFVSNVIFGWWVHNEPVTANVLGATAAILGGNIMVVIFGNRDAQELTSTDLINLYKNNNVYHAYLALAFVIWLVNHKTYVFYENARLKEGRLLWKHSFIEPFCYAVSSAVVGTQAVLNSKSLALLLESTRTGRKNEFQHWFLYFVLATWLLMVTYWLQRLDSSLEKFPPMFIIPVMQVFFVLFAIICGGIYFEEFNAFSTVQFVGFIVGVVMILLGVMCLAPSDMALYVPDDLQVKQDSRRITPSTDRDPDDPPAYSLLDHVCSPPLSKKPIPEVVYDKYEAEGLAEEPGMNAPMDSSPKKPRKVVRRPLTEKPILPPVQARGFTRGVGESGSGGVGAAYAVGEDPRPSTASTDQLEEEPEHRLT